MQISELAERTGVGVPTLKFYLREEVLPPGRLISRTRADYDETHVERVRLVRALTDVAGLPIARIRSVVAALEDPDIEAAELMGYAQRAMADDDARPEPDGGAREWARQRGWRFVPDEPLLGRLEVVLSACADAGVPVSTTRLDAYADASELIARADLASVPDDREGAVRQVVVGTVLSDQLLQVLRRLAQQNETLVDACIEPD